MITKMNRYGFLAALFIGLFSLASPASGQVTAEFHRIWVDYDITQGSEYGMLIHISLTVHGMKDRDGQLGFVFETSDGDRLYTENINYSSVAGELTIYQPVTPAYEDTFYEDVRIFMPYRELTVGSGSHDLRIHADLLYENSGWVDVHLGYHEFRFTK